MNKGPKPDFLNIAQLLIVLIVGAYGVWGSFVLFMSSFGIDTPVKYIEVIASLFAAIAVCVALLSLYFQQNNFNEQLAELKDGSFNNTFYMLIEIHNNAISALFHDGNSGQDCLKKILSDFEKKQFYNNLFPDLNSILFAKSSYQQAISPVHSELFPYLNTTSLILRLINREAPSGRKDIYIAIFTAKLTRHELVLLMYHTLLSDNINDVMDIANTFSIYKAIQEEAEESTIIQKYYSPSAFGLSSWITHE